MNRYPSKEHTADYIQRFIPLVGEQTSMDRSYAEMLYVEGLIAMAYYAQLVDTPTYKALKLELLKIYQKQVDKFLVHV